MSEELIVGKKAPEFILKNQDGKDCKLSDYKGKWLVLYFYPRDNTPGCTVEAQDFTEFKDLFDEIGVEIAGISGDSVKKHKNFIEKKDLKITLLSNEETEVIQRYGAWQLKKMYGKESMGIVRSTFVIDQEGIVVEKWEKVKVKGHVQEVYEKIKKLQQIK